MLISLRLIKLFRNKFIFKYIYNGCILFNYFFNDYEIKNDKKFLHF